MSACHENATSFGFCVAFAPEKWEEKIAQIFSMEAAELINGALLLLPNVKKIDVYFHLELITNDPDDNKFVDCAFQGMYITWLPTTNILIR